ncbi:MAG: hypothetical protein IAG13_28470, partial [Deltaproteobacteria bacterium]|nr:hypothetical protein [Nannocystaceae bacterium]
REHHGWRRVLVPSFYCQEVVAALARELPVGSYPDVPTQPLPARVDAEVDDVVLVVNLHGTRARSSTSTRGRVVEDHTHDPLGDWAVHSDADWAVASLRKTLPLPDGGVLWSPRGLHGPELRPLDPAHERAAADRLAGMTLKRDQFEGLAVDKPAYRARLAAGEQAIATGDISGICEFSAARLPSMPTAQWYAQRQHNLAAFAEALGDPPGVRLLDSTFAATLVFEHAELTTRVRESLIAARIYSAVLWSLEHADVDVADAHRELARRMLTLHCDFRYTTADMRRVAETLRHFVAVAARI